MSRVQKAIFPGILLGCTLIVFLSAASPNNVSLVSNNFQKALASAESAKQVQASVHVVSPVSNNSQQPLASLKPVQTAVPIVKPVFNNFPQAQDSSEPAQAPVPNVKPVFKNIQKPQASAASAKPAQHSSNASSSCELANSYPAAILQWCGPITADAHQNNLDPNLIAAIIEIESGGNAQAYSPSGAVGLMQIMPRDGIAAGFMCGSGSCFSSRPSTGELMNPETNIAYGARMLAGLVQRKGSVRDALFSYGPMNVGYSYADRVLQIYQSHS
jgi:soluble lytic murein transglycosylase-like protein